MNPFRIILTVGCMIGFFSLVSYVITSRIVPEETDPQVIAFDMTRPRAPSEARKTENPVPSTEEVIAQGKALYLGKGNCYVCHGRTGLGDGEAGAMLSPPPRDLADPAFQTLRADGEIFWSIVHGVPQTGMFSYVPRMITEDEAWRIVRYIRTIKRQ